MKEKIISILTEVDEEIINYSGSNLFDDGILDSLQVVNLVSKLEDELNIEIDASLVNEENFKTKETIIRTVMGIIG